MRLASYIVEGRRSYGVVVGDGVVDLWPRMAVPFSSLDALIRHGGLEEARRMAAAPAVPTFPLSAVTLLPPVTAPSTILCIGVNYANRNADFGDAEVPRYPSMFLRHPGSLVGHGAALVRPRVSDQFDYEGEIAVVIGREGRHVSRERAHEHIFGYTLCNEGSVRDYMRHGKFNVTQGKNFDRSGSIGPWLVTADAVDAGQPLRITASVNGEVTQDDTTASMIFSFADLIAYVTTFMTLRPGDVISTGTPVKKKSADGVPRWLRPGDVVEIASPQIGTLRNVVVDEDAGGPASA